MYGRPLSPVAGAAGLAATGFYAGTAVLIGVVMVILGLVLVRISHQRRHAQDPQ